MVEFIYGRTGTGKTSFCIEEIKKRLAENPQGKTLLLLCPDHMSFQLERQLAEATKDLGGFARAHVLGTSRLAYQILSREGNCEIINLTDLGKQLLLGKVLQRVDLQILKGGKSQPHFANTISDLIDEFKQSGIYPKELNDLIEKLEEGYLRSKIRDLAQIYEKLQEELGALYKDRVEVLNSAITLLPNSTWLKDAEVWIDGFDDFTNQHYNLLAGLFKVAADVHITLCIPDLKQVHGDEMDLFHHIYLMYEGAKSLGEELGQEISLRALEVDYRHGDLGLAYLGEKFMSFPLVPFNGEAGLKVVEVANSRLECEAVAADILRLCRDEGYKYQDIGILLREEDSYGELLSLVLKDYNIQAFWDKKTKINHHPLAELLRSSLDILPNWQYENIFRCLKTGFFPVAENDMDSLENYVLGTGIKGKNNWIKAEAWTYVPEGMAHNYHPFASVEAYLEEINLLRQKIAVYLGDWAESIKNCERVEDYILALYNYLVALEVPQTLEKWRNEAVAAGDLRLAKEHQQIWSNLVNLLDQFIALGAKESMSFNEFSQILLDGLDSMEMGLIPPGWDYVTMGSFEHNTLHNKRAIYILGANERVMPRQVKPSGLLTEKERSTIKALGLPLGQGAWEENCRERYLLYKGFNLSRDYLWVSYPLADTEGATLGKSVVVDWLLKLLPTAKRSYVPLASFEQSMDMELTTPKRSLANLARALNEYRAWGKIKDYWLATYNYLLGQEDLPTATVLSGLFTKAPQGKVAEDLARAMYLNNKVLRGSVTRFETFANCPFKHFLVYGLGLKPRREAKFQAPNLGILLHEIMRSFGDYLKQSNKRWADITPDECKNLCEEITDNLLQQNNYTVLRNQANFISQSERIKKLAQVSLLRLIEFNRNSVFNPLLLEARFQQGGDLPPLIVTGEDFSVEIIGQIDRLDVYENYFLVIDYKSGQADLNLIDVFYGLRIQLLTYLLVGYNSILKEKAIPAAMMYCYLKQKQILAKERMAPEEIAEAIRKKLIMPGWFMEDVEVIKLIDAQQDYIKVVITKGQEISKSSLSAVKSQEEFKLLMAYLQDLYLTTGKSIIAGESDIAPYLMENNKACQRCDYNSVCGFDRFISGYTYRELDKLPDESIMVRIAEKMEEEE